MSRVAASGLSRFPAGNEDSTQVNVTVLMCVYNGERFLGQAIDSILNQSWSGFEFVIVDDGSTDATADIVSSYKDRRIVSIQNKTNLGLIASLNRGLSAARGVYLARQDADDVSYPERLEEQVRFLDRNPQIAVVGADYLEIYDNPKSTNRIRMPASDLEIKWHGLFQSPIAHATVMFRREAIAAVGKYSTDESALHAEDYDLWSRLIWARNEFANLKKSLVQVRCDPAGVSRSNPELQYKNFRAIVQRNLQKFAPGLSNNQALAQLVWLLQVCGGFDEPLEEVEKALKTLEELVNNFCDYFQLDSRQQRRMRQIAQRRTARTLFHNAQQYSYAERVAKANEFAGLALSLDKRLALSSGYRKLRVKSLLGQQPSRRLQDVHKRIRRAIHLS